VLAVAATRRSRLANMQVPLLPRQDSEEKWCASFRVTCEGVLGFAILATAHGSVVKIVGGVIIIIAARGAWVYERRRRQRD
jgi:hypothetical protein